jgi:ketosteroid isomerase-like protein
MSGITADPEAVRAFVTGWYERWNEGDKAAWLAHWRSAFPGEPQIEDPVGKPVKRGWAMVEELWDRTFPDHLSVELEGVLACGDEAAAICRTRGTVGGVPFDIRSIDVHQFRGESLAVRSYWEIPPALPYGRWTASTGEPVPERSLT